MSETAGIEALGLTDIAARPLERIPIRRRESQVTTAAWRLELTCQQGTGSIVRVDGDAVHYRGDGILLGWPQDQLAELYQTLTRPTDNGPKQEFQQLG